MISLIVKRFTRVNVQKPTSSEGETRIPNFFMLRPQKDGSRIQSWEFWIMGEAGVGTKTV